MLGDVGNAPESRDSLVSWEPASFEVRRFPSAHPYSLLSLDGGNGIVTIEWLARSSSRQSIRYVTRVRFGSAPAAWIYSTRLFFRFRPIRGLFLHRVKKSLGQTFVVCSVEISGSMSNQRGSNRSSQSNCTNYVASLLCYTLERQFSLRIFDPFVHAEQGHNRRTQRGPPKCR